MASIIIRNLDEQTKTRLRVRAAHGKRSMEDEARHILRAALAEEAGVRQNLARSIQSRFQRHENIPQRLANSDQNKDAIAQC